MDFEKVKAYIRSQNITQFAENAKIRRAVIYDFLNDKNISSQHLITILENAFFELVPSHRVQHIEWNREDLKFDRSKTPELLRLLKLIVTHYNPKKVILFGSQATGKWTPESDFDIAIIDGVPHQRGALKLLARKNKIRLFFDYITLSEKALQQGAKSKYSLESKIIQNGVLLYEQS